MKLYQSPDQWHKYWTPFLGRLLHPNILFFHNLIRWISDSPGILFHPTSVALVLEVTQFPMYDILIHC